MHFVAFSGCRCHLVASDIHNNEQNKPFFPSSCQARGSKGVGGKWTINRYNKLIMWNVSPSLIGK